MPDFVGQTQSYPSGGTVFNIDPTNTSADQVRNLPLGTRGYSRDGRTFRWALAGGVTLVAGNALQAPAPIANHQQCAVQAAAAIGDLVIAVTLGATLATANQYAGGFITITTTPGNGYSYRIKSHPAAALSSTLALTLENDDPVQVALTTSSVASLTPHPLAGVIQTPVTTLTGAVVGGANFPLANGKYGWIQTRGFFPGLIIGTPAVGQSLSCPGAAAGGFAINSGTLDVVASAMVVGVDTTNCPIMLKLEA